jgi:hypothetical protein
VKTIAIHQPNFLPWRGYFQKIQQADIFVFLDDVQISLGSRKCVTNRVSMVRESTQKWLTMPIIRAEKISDVRLTNKQEPFEKIRNWYRKAPYFKMVIPVLKQIFAYEINYLADFNINAITILCQHLGINTPMLRSSTLGINSQKQDRILDIVSALGGDRYLSGTGAAIYQDEKAFKERDIALEYISHNLSPYPQPNCVTFIPGLSIIDLLMNCGLPPEHL